MKRKLFQILVLWSAAMAIFPQNTFNPVGIWQGKVIINPSVQLTLVLHLDKNEDGMLGATMDSPDQSAYGIKADKVTSTQDSLHFRQSLYK